MPREKRRPAKPESYVRSDGAVMVPLTQGHMCAVDPNVADRMLAFNWSAKITPVSTHVVYAVREYSKAEQELYGRRFCRMHRWIMGEPFGQTVDHINGDSLDNRRENLRVLSQADQSRNSRHHKIGASGYRGVSMDKKAKINPWRAKISHGNRTVNLGCFATVIDAAIAHDEAVVKFHGECGITNYRLGLL